MMKIKEKINKEIDLMDFEIRTYGIKSFILTTIVGNLLILGVTIYDIYVLILFFKFVF